MAALTSSVDAVTLSVVIAAHAPDPDRFRRVLSALRVAVTNAGDVETIVVRNGGPAIPDDVLAAGRGIRLVDEDRLGIAWARATGIGAARGAYIVFVDDDTVLDEDYLVEARRFAVANPSMGVFGGRIVGEFATPPAPAISAALPFLALRDFGPQEKRVAAQAEPGFDVPGAGMVLRRDIALAFARMVEDGTLAGIGRTGNSLASGDDTACCLIARRMGLPLAYVPALRLTHIIPKGRLEADYLRRLVHGIGGSAARLDALFGGIEALRILSRPQLLARRAVHIARHGMTGGLITSAWHAGYREQALREMAERNKAK
ncbi:glycosyltransferase [Mesorhizobium sp. CAU 1732]|uniref:glycosyltransferase n=1 Tax=Mesorhizobium sp. CAU 1732 TaxID=3140358 RepID=UPI0032600C8C